MDRGAWRAIVHGVAKSWTRLSTYTQLCRHPAPPPAAHEPETVLVGCELDPINIPQRLNYLVFTTPPHLKKKNKNKTKMCRLGTILSFMLFYHLLLGLRGQTHTPGKGPPTRQTPKGHLESISYILS